LKKKTKKYGKRILIIAPQPFYEDRGTPIAIYETLVTLNELGFNVDLATYPVGSEVNLPGTNIFRTANPFRYRNVRISFSFPKLVLDMCLLATVLRLLNRNQYDCIHGVEEGAAIALICKRLFSIPVIYDMQSSMPEQLRDFKFFKAGFGRWLALSLERWLIRNVNFIVASRGLAPHVLSIEPGKAVLECTFEGNTPIPRDENMAGAIGTLGHPTVMYTGNFAPYQGLDNLMEAIALVCEEIPNVLFLIVGGTSAEISRLSRLLNRYKLAGCVKMVKRKPRTEMPYYIALADVLVLPRLEGKNIPLKLYDYLRSGTPIVATDISAHRALLSEETAILVKPDSESISDGIIRAFKDTEYAKKIASAAKATISREDMKPLEQTIANAYNFVFRSIVKKAVE